MQMLGFAPYHMKELVLRGGIRHMKLLIESMRAEYDRFSGIKRYSRKDFAKWFSDYDVGLASCISMPLLRITTDFNSR